MTSTLTYDQPAILQQEVRTILAAALENSHFPKIHVPKHDGPYNPGRNSLFHALPEIFFQLSGSNQFDCGAECFVLDAGEICIMPAGVPHREQGGTEPFCGFVIVHDTSRVILLGLNCNEGDRPWITPIKTCLPFHGQRLADLLSETAEAFRRDAPAAPHLFRAYLALILEEYDRPTEAHPHSPLVARCMDLLFAEMGSTDLSIAQIAQRLHCNANSLSARFSKETGQTAIEYLTQLRIEQAKQLLQETVLSMAEIAWASGFQDPNYFSRIFKKQTGDTPRTYRKRSLFQI